MEDIVTYRTEEKVAYITLNRPQRYNAIHLETPRLLKEAVDKANQDDSVHVIVLSGNGKAFCAGYDLSEYAETKGLNPCFQSMPWDPLVDYQRMGYCTQCWMSLWRSLKPVICKVHGYAVGGGSDIALCCDIVIMAEDAKIGYPPARLWGCPTTFMWVFRVGAERAKRILLTGDLLTGKEAEQIGLITKAVPADKLDAEVQRLVSRMVTVPKNQLMMQKLVVNSAYDNMGLATTQTLATLMDGIARHTPEGVAFKQECERIGWKAAVQKRDNPELVSTSHRPAKAKL